ncbi:TPA: hypothetical protein DIV45_02360 [Patescibacteria group bacterium]|nr:hypothetical protein [Patescibacteria group bacterium]
MARPSKKISTQKYLPFKEVREGVITMKDGSRRVVLMVDSINFNLKSADEQTALLDSFKNFLNSLEFPLQIVVQSRILDLDGYLKNLETMAKKQSNELLQSHTREYIEFIRELIGISNIMSKTFYVVISDHAIQEAGGSILSRLFSRKAITPAGQFQEVRGQLISAANLVAGSLGSMGLSSVLLNTKELIDLLYSTYNPDIARRQKLFNASYVDAKIITTQTNQP